MLLRLACLACVLAPTARAQAACEAAGAAYISVDDPGFTAGFAPKPPGGRFVSDLAFYVHSAATRRTFWFLFDAGSARYMNLIAALDINAKDWHPPDPDGPGHRPERGFDMTYLQSGAGLHFRHDAPRQGGTAPVYILLPDLAERMWYAADPREDAPVGVFKRLHCGR
jgi:hypothetical protein